MTCERDLKAEAHRWGAELLADGSARFRIWAPSQERMSIKVDGGIHPMTKTNGWFEALVDEAREGAEYGFLLEDGRFVPDPASRRQARGLAGPSVLTSCDYEWTHAGWRGRPWDESVIYEIHIGAFTPEGTFRAAIEKLAELAATGFTAVEIMPVAHFPGERGWGYDGVLLYAPHPAYGTPDDLKAFIDAAHGRGLMVFLDVVYNHFGSLDNYLSTYAPDFFRAEGTPWGPAIAFEQPAVRQYFIDNALHWLGDYRFDGLRLDAVDQIRDDSAVHFLAELAAAVRRCCHGRRVHLAVENPASAPDLLMRAQSGEKLYDADWNDDFHHSMHVAATGECGGIYEKFAARPWKKVNHALARGPVFPGRPALGKAAAQTNELRASAYVHFLQNHDQVGNRALGERLRHMVDKNELALWTTVLLLSPQIPLMFMGDHYLARTPFHFFADYEGEIAEAIRSNRPVEARNFGGIAMPGKTEADMPDPISLEALLHSKLDWREARSPEARAWTDFVATLIALRKTHVLPWVGKPCRARILSEKDRFVAVDWSFDHQLIEMRANFSDQPIADAPVKGEPIYVSHTFDPAVIAAASVVVACSDR